MTEARTPVTDTMRLTGYCSRAWRSRRAGFGLVAHELVGHGGAALAVGGQVTEVQLFWFAGGWIRYDLPHRARAALLAIAMGGVAVELVAGTAAVARSSAATSLGPARSRARSARRSSSTRRWYLATGAWHGYGDGRCSIASSATRAIRSRSRAGAVDVRVRRTSARAACSARSLRRCRGIARARIARSSRCRSRAASTPGSRSASSQLRRDATYAADDGARARARDRARSRARGLASAPRRATDAPRRARRGARSSRRRTATFPFAWLLGGARRRSRSSPARWRSPRPGTAQPIAPGCSRVRRRWPASRSRS